MSKHRSRPHFDLTIGLLIVAAILAAGLFRGTYSKASLDAALGLPPEVKELILDGFGVLVAVVAILIRFVRRYIFSRRDAGGLLTWVTVLFLAFPLWLFYVGKTSDGVTSLAAIMATIGWLGQRNQNSRNARKQHTLNVLFHFRLSEVFNNHRINVMSQWPEGSIMTPDDADKLLVARATASEWKFSEGRAKFPIVESVQHILSFYEYLCAGVEVGDIDEPFLRETIWPIMKEFYIRMRAYIEHEANLGVVIQRRCFRAPVWKTTKVRYIHYYNVFMKEDSDLIKRIDPNPSSCWTRIIAKLKPARTG